MVIDDADLGRIAGLKLHSEARGQTRYVRCRRPGQRTGGAYLHNFLIGGRADHIDGDGLNNDRRNLRPCTQAQNGLNRAPKRGKRFKGVYRHRSGNFYAQIALAGRVYSSRSFCDEVTAALAYDWMARRLHGQWARLNLPDRRWDGREPAFRWLDKADNRQKEMPL
jgi:hypothetical protein